MKLKELKTIVSSVDADNLRLAGFCDDFSKMPEKNQFKVIETLHTVSIINMDFVDDLPVFDSSQTKEQLISLPSAYDDYEVLLVGGEETNSEPQLKCVMKTQRLDDPSDPRNAGLCLLGPTFHQPYRVLIVFADTRKANKIECGDDISVNEWGEPYFSDEFDTKEEMENFVHHLQNVGKIDESVGDRIIYY